MQVQHDLSLLDERYFVVDLQPGPLGIEFVPMAASTPSALPPNPIGCIVWKIHPLTRLNSNTVHDRARSKIMEGDIVCTVNGVDVRGRATSGAHACMQGHGTFVIPVNVCRYHLDDQTPRGNSAQSRVPTGGSAGALTCGSFSHFSDDTGLSRQFKTSHKNLLQVHLKLMV